MSNKRSFVYNKKIKENASNSELSNVGIGDTIHIKSQNKTGMYYGEENGKIKVKTPSGMELASKDDIEVIPDEYDFMDESSLKSIVDDIERRLLESDSSEKIEEGAVKNAALAAMLGLGMYGGFEATDADNTPLAKAMETAAEQGDEYAAKELKNLTLYLDAGDTRMLTKLSNKYLGPMKDRTMNEATSHQSDLDPEKKVVVKGVKGMDSKSFTKTFRNMKSAEKWIDDNEGDFEIKQIENEDSVAEAKHNSPTKDRTMNETKLTEGIIDRLRNIVDEKQATRVTFDNGETLEVDLFTASAIVSLYNAVNDKNKAKMEDNIGKKEMFQKFADFAFQQSNSSKNESELTEKDEDDPCWDGYEQYGMKTKDGEEVPNCVPIDEAGVKKEENLLSAMKNREIAESMGISTQQARESLRKIYGYDDLAIARAQLDETTSAGSVAAVSAPIGDTKKRSVFGEENTDNKDSEFDSAWFYKTVDGEVEGPYKSEKEATNAANNYADWVKQGSELEDTDRRLAKRAFLMRSSLSESKTVKSLEKKFRSQLNEAMNVNVNIDPKQPETRSISVTASDQEADSLAGLLSNAGLFSSSGYGEVQFQEPEVTNSCGCDSADSEMAMEEDGDYSNSPDEKYQDMKYMLDIVSGGLNREKNSYDKAEDGDNPMDVVKEEEDTAVGTMDEFYSYVLDFYGPNGIYDIGATEEEVKKATEIVKNEVGDDFYGDSADREKVRDVILDQMRSEEEREEAEKAFRSREEVDYDKINDMMSDVPNPIQTRGDVDDDMDRMRNFNETDEVKRLAGLV